MSLRLMLDSQDENLDVDIPKIRISRACSQVSQVDTHSSPLVYSASQLNLGRRRISIRFNHEVGQVRAQIVPLGRPIRISRYVSLRFFFNSPSLLSLVHEFAIMANSSTGMRNR